MKMRIRQKYGYAGIEHGDNQLNHSTIPKRVQMICMLSISYFIAI